MLLTIGDYGEISELIIKYPPVFICRIVFVFLDEANALL